MAEQNTAPRRHGPMGGHGPGPRIAEKPKNFKKAMAKLIGFIRPYILLIVIALLFAVGGVVLNLVGPNVLSDLTDAIRSSFLYDAEHGVDMVFVMDTDRVFSLCILLVVLYGAGLLCSYIQGLIMATVTQKNSRNLRTAISEKINRIPLRYFDSHSIGDVLSRVTNDVDMIGQTLNQSLVTFVTAVVMLLRKNILRANSGISARSTGISKSPMRDTMSSKHITPKMPLKIPSIASIINCIRARGNRNSFRG